MPVHISWDDAAIRLILTVVAGAVIGINRSERGRPAGFRTTILVCLAASISMIQANLLMPTTGKTPESFAVFDLMRLPLGILTGMGFIGAGAIVRKGDMVQGVTTAATLWFVRVMGLCFGGGQIDLGLAALALALIVLWGLKKLEQSFNQDRHATLTVRWADQGSTESAIQTMLAEAGFQIGEWNVAYKRVNESRRVQIRAEVRWHGNLMDRKTPSFVHELKRQPGVEFIQWKD